MPNEVNNSRGKLGKYLPPNRGKRVGISHRKYKIYKVHNRDKSLNLLWIFLEVVRGTYPITIFPPLGTLGYTNGKIVMWIKSGTLQSQVLGKE